MSGESAMAVCYGDRDIEASVEPSASCGRTRLLQMVSREFARTLVSSAAGVIAGIKPVALFSFAPSGQLNAGGRARQDLDGVLREVLCAYGRGASALGLQVEAVGAIRGRTMLLAWRGGLVNAVLGDSEKRDMLEVAGFSTQDVASLMSDVRARLASYYGARACGQTAFFPHELGVLFGYPAEDVRGFMSGQQATCRGPWCAYGDAEKARERFRKVARCEQVCRQRFRLGESLGALVAAPWDPYGIEKFARLDEAV